MARGFLNIDTHEVAIHVNRLEKMHKSALPSAIRGTLNGLAFDTKKNSMPKEAQRAFVNRKKNFFKATSRVKTAQGFNVNSMKSTIGFIGGDDNQAVDDLNQQERGGSIGSRAFIPTTKSRTGKTPTKGVAKRNRLSGIKNVVRVADAEGKNQKEKFIRSAVHAGKGGVLLTNNALVRVKSINRKGRGTWKIVTENIYSFKDNRSVRIKATGFMKKATISSAKKGGQIFNKEAERQIKRLQGR